VTVAQPPGGMLNKGGQASPASTDGAARPGPVIVLTYGHAGGGRLQSALSGHPALACTTGTGLLAACDQAAAAWRQAEGRRQGPLSQLAAASVRALAAGVMTSVVVRAGKRRWCETAAAERSAAETFLALFPAARFVCLHRACPDVIYATLQASPWGLAGPAFAAYTTAHPGSTVAALAAWWTGHAGPMLAFEQDHPQACLRVRYEDLVADPAAAERDILAFLDLDAHVPEQPEFSGDDSLDPAGLTGADAPGCGADLPVGQLPPLLLAQVNNLHARLGYPPLQASE
jgi:protein-tyrosine sulfotransferase